MSPMIFLFVSFFVGVFCKSSLLSLEKSKTPIRAQKEAVEGLINRVLSGKMVDTFKVEIDITLDSYFEISNENNFVLLKGKDGVAASSAFYYYLQHFSNSSVEWETRNINYDFPMPTKIVKKNDLVRYRYIFNVCTFGYTMVSWSFEEWERLIDWMALHGINLPLSFTGQEIVWMRLFKEFGLTEDQIFEYMSGPHFLPWFRMGNIRKWGGKLSNEWIDDQANLQKKILERQRSFGMQPVLPAFSGFIPDAFVQKYPDIKYSRLPLWAFNGTYSGDCLLDPQDDMFNQLGKRFLEIQAEEFGTDHIYNCDTFNEMTPKSSDPDYLKGVASAVFQSMVSGDKDAVWMLQGWLFTDREFWKNEQIEAYLSPVPNDKMIILDLWSEIQPIFPDTESYFGKPFIWCILKNFGGRRGLYGSFTPLSTQPIEDSLNEKYTLEGFGITSEAIYTPPFIYELFSSLYLMEKPMTALDRYYWLNSYMVGKYGKEATNFDMKSSWDLISKGLYELKPVDYGGTWKLSIFDNRPRFGLSFSDNTSYVDHTVSAWKLWFKNFREVKTFTDGYLYDIVDLTRQFLSNYFNELYNVFIQLDKNAKSQKTIYANEMLDLLLRLDKVLETNENFLVGKWINDARTMGKDEMEKDLFEFNARNQLTVWGPEASKQSIDDYAKKHWAGLVKDYYYNRWSVFLEYAIQVDFNETEYNKASYMEENKFQNEKKHYPSTPSGDITEALEDINKAYVEKKEEFECMKETDLIGDEHTLAKTVTHDIETLKVICSLDSKCVGFNSKGLLKQGFDKVQKEIGVDLYVKKV